MQTQIKKIDIMVRFKNICLDKYDELLTNIHNYTLFSVHNLSEILSTKLTHIYILTQYLPYLLNIFILRDFLALSERYNNKIYNQDFVIQTAETRLKKRYTYLIKQTIIKNNFNIFYGNVK